MAGCGRFEELIARYVHGQVLHQEKEDLESHIAVCGSCEMLYREITDLDRILRGIPGKLVDPPSRLRAGILADLPDGAPLPAWNRWGKWVAGIAAAAACMLAVAVYYTGTVREEARVAALSAAPPRTEREGVPAPVPDRPAAPAARPAAKSPAKPPAVEVKVIREVRIYFYYPSASRVAVTGDFNGWNPEGEPLSASGDKGFWTATLRLSPGAYSYNFIVDGNLIVPDPNAPDQTPDGYGGTNSILLVRGGDPA